MIGIVGAVHTVHGYKPTSALNSFSTSVDLIHSQKLVSRRWKEPSEK